jgi:amino acid transporter
MLAEEGLFPEWFGPKSRFGPHAGLLLTAAFVLVVANLVDLSAIASVGSAVALMVFFLVGLAGWRRRADTGSSPALILLAVALVAIVLGFFAVDTYQNAPATFGAILGLGVLAVILDAVFRRSQTPARA